jgi:hypothetical protein
VFFGRDAILDHREWIAAVITAAVVAVPLSLLLLKSRWL